MAKRKVLFIYPFPSSFINKDLNILKEEFEVVSLEYRGKKDMFRLLKNVIATDLNVSWFSLGHATFAVWFSRFFRKRSIIIAGGWDVVSMPEKGYGAMRNEKRVKKTRYALERANKILAVSESTKNWVLKWVKRDDIAVLYHGFDANTFVPKGKKEELVVTVGKLQNDVTIRIKGLDTFLKTAELLPDVEFAIIGKHDPQIAQIWKEKASANLKIVDFLAAEELLGYYQKAKVYAQLSYQESFGCALAEAMLCQCIPVVTRNGAIPEVVGDVGLYAKYGDAEDSARRIEEALDSEKGHDARERIMTQFPLDERKKKLTQIVSDCMK